MKLTIIALIAAAASGVKLHKAHAQIERTADEQRALDESDRMEDETARAEAGDPSEMYNFFHDAQINENAAQTEWEHTANQEMEEQ